MLCIHVVLHSMSICNKYQLREWFQHLLRILITNCHMVYLYNEWMLSRSIFCQFLLATATKKLADLPWHCTTSLKRPKSEWQNEVMGNSMQILYTKYHHLISTTHQHYNQYKQCPFIDEQYQSIYPIVQVLCSFALALSCNTFADVGWAGI